MNRKDQSAAGADVLTRNPESTLAEGLTSQALGGLGIHERARLFDGSIVGTAQEAVEFITNILESSTEYSVIAKDLTGKILLWNEGARRLYGYEPNEVVGRANSSILHAPQDVKAGVPEQIMEAALEQGKWEGTLTRQRKNGEQFTARVVITPRRDSSGKAIGFLLISKDISDEIRLTQYARSLIEASVDPLVTISPEGKITDVNEATVKVTGASREKLIGADFANYFTEPEKAREGYQRVFSQGFVTDYSVSHDLRAPLRGIDGFSLALLEDYADKLDEKGKDYLHRVRAATQRMGILIDDLLNLSRVTRSEMRLENSDLSAIARSVAVELQKVDPERRVEFRIEEGLETFVDSHLLRITLENLLGNAWKFTSKRESACIEFGKTHVDGKSPYYVRDNGAGFDPAYADRLFGAFQRLHDRNDFPGTGVGLATVQRIIHRHGGHIWAQSAVEEGATFYFTLPETKHRGA